MKYVNLVIISDKIQPIIGDSTKKSKINIKLHTLIDLSPLKNKDDPTNAPINECDDEAGIPIFTIIKLNNIAEKSAIIKDSLFIYLISNNPVLNVLIIDIPNINGPIKFPMDAISKEIFKGKILFDIRVETIIPLSANPLRNANIKINNIVIEKTRLFIMNLFKY
ncbi:MAG: hypothetical protein M1326_07900 [Cyanobacteria bacterium]|nr:hypothetical protein [Cyanobacteriota bacterium]